MDIVSLLALVAPLLVDGGKALIQKYFAPDEFKPASIDDYTKMRTLDLQMFQAMNTAGGANPSYPWVEAIVRLQRPAVAFIALSVWATLKLNGVESPDVTQFANAIAFYLFGDRTLFYTKQAVREKNAK